MKISLEYIILGICELEEKTQNCAMVYCAPEKNDIDFYLGMCEFFEKSADSERNKIFEALNGKNGILNRLLGLVFESADNLKKTGDVFWLQTGLTAAKIQGDRLDPRDFLLALAELYFASKEAGIDPDLFFENSKGAIPSNFKDYAVVKNRR